jgi:nucleoside triphosphate pyrophosphatase
MALWLAGEPLILASSSRIRKELLVGAGVLVETCSADLDERAVETSAASQRPGAVAALLAREKATCVARRKPGRLVLGADQVLAVDSRRFAKPADRAAARAQLLSLRGRTHELHSAIAFLQDGKAAFEHVGIARLAMRDFSDRFLDAYLDAIGDAATASVGAYQLESLGVELFERVEGDYFTVLGLPLLAVLDFLRRQGCLLP